MVIGSFILSLYCILIALTFYAMIEPLTIEVINETSGSRRVSTVNKVVRRAGRAVEGGRVNERHDDVQLRGMSRSRRRRVAVLKTTAFQDHLTELYVAAACRVLCVVCLTGCGQRVSDGCVCAYCVR